MSSPQPSQKENSITNLKKKCFNPKGLHSSICSPPYSVCFICKHFCKKFRIAIEMDLCMKNGMYIADKNLII